MTSVPRTLLILGAGPNVGSGVARAFAEKGYKVATTSRSSETKIEGGSDLHLQADLSNPSSVADIFGKVQKALGPPSVVVYNASSHTPSPKDDPLSLSIKDAERDLSITTISAFAAAHEATVAFKSLPPTASRTFIFTGNRLNIAPIPGFLSQGMGKSASAAFIENASGSYTDKGYKFYYADERKPDGSPAFRISGAAHGKFYLQLAEKEIQVPWLATFVNGSGDYAARLIDRARL